MADIDNPSEYDPPASYVDPWTELEEYEDFVERLAQGPECDHGNDPRMRDDEECWKKWAEWYNQR
jgi:hypothetical protein